MHVRKFTMRSYCKVMYARAMSDTEIRTARELYTATLHLKRATSVVLDYLVLDHFSIVRWQVRTTAHAPSDEIGVTVGSCVGHMHLKMAIISVWVSKRGWLTTKPRCPPFGNYY